MRERTQREINEEGFKALVEALGREDALRFINQFAPRASSAGDGSTADEQTLPAYTPDEIHNLIRDMQEPTDQAHLL